MHCTRLDISQIYDKINVRIKLQKSQFKNVTFES